MMNARRQLSTLFAASALGLGFAAPNAHALITVDNTDPLQTISTQCQTSEVTLDGIAPGSCAGYYSLGNYGDNTVRDQLNTVTNSTDWVYTFKLNVDDGPQVGDLLFGIQFTVLSVNNATGIYTIEWVDTNAGAAANLPLYVDLAPAFKAGSGQVDAGIAYFLFDEFLLDDVPDNSAIGTFNLVVNPDVSFVGLYARLGTTVYVPPVDPPVEPPAETPEPGVLLLMGAGLLGLGMARRRKSA